jgi:hypothetical protein
MTLAGRYESEQYDLVCRVRSAFCAALPPISRPQRNLIATAFQPYRYLTGNTPRLAEINLRTPKLTFSLKVLWKYPKRFEVLSGGPFSFLHQLHCRSAKIHAQ